MPRLRSLLALSARDRRLLAEACLRLLAAAAGLRLLPFARLMSTIDARPGARVAPDVALVARVRWAVERAARHLPLPLTCLPQALAAAWMLQARGFAPRMLYGVAPRVGQPEGFEAHAWVELDGTPVVGHRVAHRFTLLATFPLDAGTPA